MIHLELGTARIFVRPGATDMRKQINGLVLLVQEQMQLSPFEPALFVFCNAQRRLLKAVYWDRTGFLSVDEAAGEGAFSVAADGRPRRAARSTHRSCGCCCWGSISGTRIGS